MKINVIKTRPLLHEIYVEDLGYSPAELLVDLAAEDWQEEKFNIPGKLRVWELKSKKLQEIVDYFSSSEFHKIVVDRLHSDSEFASMWFTEPEEFVKKTSSSAIWTCDLPGYYAPVHLDNRRLVANSMIFFNTLAGDVDHSTVFYTDEQLSNPAAMPTSFGSGWLAANAHNSWHEGFNKSSYNRYNIYHSLMLNCFP